MVMVEYLGPLSIKALSQSIKQPLLTSFSTIIQNDRKKYYGSLEKNSHDNEITDWIIYFSRTFLESQKYTQKLIEFLLAKTKLFNKLQGQLNERQEKVLHRMFEQGLDGFKVGLSAENYLKITKTSRTTATRDLQDLVKKGALLKVGELKATRYFLDLNI